MAVPNAIIGRLAGAARWTAWARALALANVALALKRHLDLLDEDEKSELRSLVTKSKGRPSNLTAKERDRLGELVSKVEPSDFAREAVSSVIPLRGRK